MLPLLGDPDPVDQPGDRRRARAGARRRSAGCRRDATDRRVRAAKASSRAGCGRAFFSSASIMAAGTLLVLDASLPGGFIEGSGSMRYAQTMAFTTLMLFQLFNVFNARSDEQSAFTGLLSQPMAVGRHRPVARAAGGRHLRAFSAKGLLDRQPEPRRLAAVHACRQLGTVAARAEQTGKAHSALNRRRHPASPAIDSLLGLRSDVGRQGHAAFLGMQSVHSPLSPHSQHLLGKQVPPAGLPPPPSPPPPPFSGTSSTSMHSRQ